MGEKQNESGNKPDFLNSFSIGVMNMAFSKEKKIERIVLILVLIGFILRLFAALNEGVLADDMVFASQSAGILGSKILSTHSNPPLVFYLTDVAYKIFGHTTFASRFWQLIFGTLLIPLGFLISKKLFNEKVALASAFFITFSNFLTRMTFSEQSLIVLFFSFSGIYLGLEYLDNKKKLFLIGSAITFGLACLSKYNGPFFVIAFLAFALFRIRIKNEKILTKRKISYLLLFLLVVFLFCLPFLTFNYLLYKDKGIVDVYFSRVIQTQKTQELYGGLAGQGSSFFQNIFSINSYTNITLLYHADIILLIFSLLGLYILLKSKNYIPLLFFGIFFVIPFVMQSAGSVLQKHFAFMPIIFAIPAGLALEKLYRKLNKNYLNKILIAVLAVLFIVNLGVVWGVPNGYFSKSDNSQLKSFIHNNVGAGDLVIMDTRIYTARSFWLASPHHMLLLQQFPEFYQYNLNLSQEYLKSTKVFVVECAMDDCGWGAEQIKGINESSENILESIKNFSQKVSSIDFYNYNPNNEVFGKKTRVNSYNVYLLNVPLNSQLIEQIDKVNSFYFTPYLYKNMADYLFNYNVSNSFDSMLNKLSYYVIILSIVLSILSIILLIYMLLR